MTVNLTVQAAVIDLRTDRPRQSDLFLVDTNAWIWQTYPNVSAVGEKPMETARAIKCRESYWCVSAME
jgi:hypothetical protein